MFNKNITSKYATTLRVEYKNFRQDK